VTLEVRFHRFKKCENDGRKTEKDGGVGKARWGIGI